MALGYFRRSPEVWWKEGNSPVSEADLAVDRFLKDALLRARPDYGWLSEETAPDPAARSDPDAPFFVVDPIDGTRAFLRGEDTWCVSIALVARGRPAVGVLDMPATDEVFEAVAGGAATRNGAPIAVRPETAGPPLVLAVPDGARRRLGAALEPFQLERSAPSLACRLAAVAAGDLILERAGGSLVDAAGRTCLYKIEGRRHGVLVAAAAHALPALIALAGAA